MAFFAAIAGARGATAAVTFPLEVKWSATLPSSPAFAPAFDADYMYVALRTNVLAALVINDGTEVWWVECPMTAPPAAGDGLVYIGNDGSIDARAQLDGQVKWRREVQGRVVSLHWDTGWLFAQTEPGAFFAIRATDGHIVWQKDFGSPVGDAKPAPAGERLYLPLKDGRIVAVTLETGTEIWTRKFTESATGILPVGNRVYAGARDKFFYSFDAKNGNTDWDWQTGADLLGLPVLDARRVYFVALDNILRGHNRNNGSMMWKQVLPMRPFTGPILSGQTLIVAGVASELHAYSAADGKPVDDFALKGVENEEMLLAAPPHLTAQDLFILVTKGGQVRAVGGSPTGAATPAPGSGGPSTPETPPPADDPDPTPGVGAASPEP